MRELTFNQGDLEWHKARAGIVTGTSLKQAVSKNFYPLMWELIAERMTEIEITDLNTPAVERGREMEPIALRRYIEASGLSFETTGMLLSDDIDHFGMSPDAVYREDGVIVGGLEIKCPSSKKHVEYLLKNKVPAEYFHQVLSPFLISEDVLWWDFVSFDDRNYERPLFHIRTTREEVEEPIRETLAALIKFLAKVDQKHIDLTF
jgi:hypothetical protein